MRPGDPLSQELVESILERLPRLRVGVLGDLFLDRYLDIDAALTEPSVETGLEAYQVTGVRAYPGAAGTVVNNIEALGVGSVAPFSVIGDDGEGHELRMALAELGAVDAEGVLCWGGRRTPTYIKPMLCRAGEAPRELNRLDIKNREPLPRTVEDLVIEALEKDWDHLDALVVLDQVSEADCGVVTARVRRCLAELAGGRPDLFVLADSRERIGLFRRVSLKPNRRECLGAAGGEDLPAAVAQLARKAERPVFCTCGDEGVLLADPWREDGSPVRIAGYLVQGPTDPVGAGDSTSAGIACAVAAGATLEQAAAFGCLVASITVRQIGSTGTATPEQVRHRLREINGQGA
jgi:bifunctional ADP-heptose synthase (sugar kinase/adenylyltransferase)